MTENIKLPRKLSEERGRPLRAGRAMRRDRKSGSLGQ